MEALIPHFVTAAQIALGADCNLRTMHTQISGLGINADAVLDSPFGRINLYLSTRVEEVRSAVALNSAKEIAR